MIKFEDCDERNNIPNFEGMLVSQKSKSPYRKSQRKGLQSDSTLDKAENGKSVSTRNKQKNGKAFGRLVDFDFSFEDDVEEEEEEEEELEERSRGVGGRRGEEMGRNRDRGRDRSRGRKIAEEEEVPLILKLSKPQSKPSNKSVSTPIKVQSAVDVVDLSNNRNRRRSAVLISPAKATAAAAVLVPAVAYIGRKRDRERAERRLEEAERAKAEAEAEAEIKKFEEILRAKEKKKASRRVTTESLVSLGATVNIDAKVTFETADILRRGAKKSKLMAKDIEEARSEATKSYTKRKASFGVQTSSSLTAYPPSSLPPFLVSVLRDDPLTAAIYQTFACDMIIRKSSDTNNKTEAEGLNETDKEGDEKEGDEKEGDEKEGDEKEGGEIEGGEAGINTIGFSAIFSMAGLDCLNMTKDENNLGMIEMKYRGIEGSIILYMPSLFDKQK